MRGSSSSSGPAPDPNALRRERDSGDWHRLPATGRADPAPAWPLIRPSKRELTHWHREWARPQAIMWERLHLEIEVALYVRRLTEGEVPDASTSLGTLIRQMQEALGLSLPGLARNRWVIEAAPKVTTTNATRRDRDKNRLTALEGGAAS